MVLPVSSIVPCAQFPSVEVFFFPKGLISVTYMVLLDTFLLKFPIRSRAGWDIDLISEEVWEEILQSLPLVSFSPSNR